MAEQLDQEMLKNLDLLLDLDVAETEPDWDTVEQLEDDKTPEPTDKKEPAHE